MHHDHSAYPGQAEGKYEYPDVKLTGRIVVAVKIIADEMDGDFPKLRNVSDVESVDGDAMRDGLHNLYLNGEEKWSLFVNRDISSEEFMNDIGPTLF